MRTTCLAAWTSLALVLGAYAPPAGASEPPASAATTQTAPASDAQSDEDKKLIADAMALLQSGKPQDVIDGPLNGLIARYEATYPSAAGVTVFTAKTRPDTLMYLVEGASHPPHDKDGKPENVTVLGYAWAQAYWARGYAYGELQKYDLEEAELAKALTLSPRDTQYLNELGFVYQRRGQWQRSLDTYKQAAEYAAVASPAPTETGCTAFRGQGYVLVEMSRLDDAEAAYQSCLKLIPGEKRSLAEIGYIQGLRAKLH